MKSLLDTFLGLPVHALIVHAVVVLVPLTAIGAIIMVCSTRFSRRFGILFVLVSGLSFFLAFVAKESGEQLAKRVGSPQPHVEVGARMPLFAFALSVVLAIFWLFDRGIPGNRTRPVWLWVLGVVVILVAILATIWVVRVGDSGAQATWRVRIEATQ